MNRKPRPTKKTLCAEKGLTENDLSDWHQYLISRRQFLITSAGGSLAAVFPLSSEAINGKKSATKLNPWPILDRLQQHLFPTEVNAPGARQINALGYLKFVVTDTTLDANSREFISRGTVWLEGMTQRMYKQSFINLNTIKRERVLQRIILSQAGENWISTLMLYLTEALLTDPIYGGNTQQIGWKWLQHIPGFPRPPLDKTFPQLLAHDY